MINKNQFIIRKAGTKDEVLKRNAFRMIVPSAKNIWRGAEGTEDGYECHTLEIRPTFYKCSRGPKAVSQFEIVYDDLCMHYLVLPVPDKDTQNLELSDGEWIRVAVKILVEDASWPFVEEFTKNVLADVENYITELEQHAGE